MFNGKAGVTTPSQTYKISRSVRLRSTAPGSFSRTFAAGSINRCTWSAWVKRGSLGSISYMFWGNASYTTSIGFDAANALSIQTGSPGSSLGSFLWATSAVYRDTSAWYHIVVAWDTTQATATNRLSVYVNGIQITSFGTQQTITQNMTIGLAGAAVQMPTSSSGFDGYMTEVNFVDGQALTPSSFGAFNQDNTWRPIKYTGTYGTNGFYLNFSDNSAATAAAIGKDYSGNGNNWTPTNISVTAGATYDSMLDVPTFYRDDGNGRGNYCTLNPVDSLGTTTNAANLNAAYNASGFAIRGTMAFPSTGKWYYEMTQSGTGDNFIGLAPEGATISNLSAGSTGLYAYYGGGFKYTNGSATAYGATFTNLDVIGVAVDSGAGTVTFYKNNVSQGVAFTGLDFSTNWLPMIRVSGVGVTAQTNFGQRPFTYTPPTDFKALNTANLPASGVNRGSEHFAVTTYTGDGTSSKVITNTVNGLSFQPDFVWLKVRNAVDNHGIADSLRGTPKLIQTNLTAAEIAAPLQGFVSSFNSNGFTIASGATNNTNYNTNNNTYVAWQWKAGGTAVTNTNGSITSQVSANPTAGFSVVTYTGTGANATVGHGLGSVPKMIIVKNVSAVQNWQVYHVATAATNYMSLNLTDLSQANIIVWNNTEPTSTVFSIGTGARVNGSTNSMVAYCWSEVPGYSKFGSYTGNGSADGPFVYCGFRPRFVLLKATTGTESWQLIDTSRRTFNVNGYLLQPNTTGVENTASWTTLDVLSNGFKLRDANTGFNGGTVYIYAAFAEVPFRNANAS